MSIVLNRNIKRCVRLALILALLTASRPMFGQMTVESFRPLENDLTAITNGTLEFDQNGDVAALIKIVVTGNGFTFDVGSLGVVKVRQMGGEWWVYVPRGIQRITINHPQYGVLRNYYFDIPIEGARTYELVLNPGVGKFMNITTSTAGAVVLMDGDTLGTAPLVQQYIIYGDHNFVATLDKMYGQLTASVSENSDAAVSIELEDQSYLYSPVTINVANNAEIWFEGKYQGNGTFTTELKNGTYTIETRKSGCSDAVTVIEVDGSGNTVFAVNAPEPYKGSLNVYVPMSDVVITDHTDDGRKLRSGTREILNIGTHFVSFSRKGYVTVEKEYEILRDVELNDTVRLEHYPFIKANQFYAGVSGAYSGGIYPTAVIGATFRNIDLEVSYSLGLSDIGTVCWYNSMDNSLYSRMSYKNNMIGIRAGYQFPLSLRLSVIPQAGMTIAMLSGTLLEGNGQLGNNAMGASISVGGKLLFFPLRHMALFIRPEFMVSLGDKNTAYASIIDKCGSSTGQFGVTAGLALVF